MAASSPTQSGHQLWPELVDTFSDVDDLQKYLQLFLSLIGILQTSH